MPGGGGNPYLSAVSTAMKHYHPGKSPKPTKIDKHQARLAGRVEGQLERRACFLELGRLYRQMLLLRTLASSARERKRLDKDIAALSEMIWRLGGTFYGLSGGGASGGGSSCAAIARSHGPPGAWAGFLNALPEAMKLATRRMLSVLLAASVLFLGIAQGTAGAGTSQKGEAAQTELSGAKTLNLETPSYLQLYDNLIKEGTELAANPEKRKEAVEAFMKAIQLYPENAKKPLSTLDEKTMPVYMEAMQKTSKPSIEEPAEKKKKSNTALWIVGGVVIGAIAGYGIYKMLNKGEEPADNRVDLKFKIINATEGILVDEHSLPKITPDTEVTISISDLISRYGITGVDDKRIIIRGPLDNCEYVDFERDGDSTFKVDSVKHKAYNYNYTIFLLPTQTSQNEYEKLEYWIDAGAGKLYFTPSWTYHRVDIGEATGPQKPLDDAVAKINAAVSHSWITIFNISTGGTDMAVGYYLGPDTQYGKHSRGPPPSAFVNANTVHDDILRTRIATSEISELAGQFDDLNPGNSYSYLTDSSGRLTLHGIQFLNYLGIKDTQKIGVVTAANALNAMTQVVDLSFDLGSGVSVGLNGNGVDVRYKGRNIDLATATNLVSGGIRNATNVNYTNGNVNASIATIVSPTEQVYSAQGSTRIGKTGMDLGLRGAFDARNNNNALGLTIGKNGNKAGFTFSYDTSNSRNNKSNAFRLSTNFDLGGNRLALTGAYTESRGVLPVEALTIGANASLEKLMPGLNLTGSFSQLRQGAYQGSVASLGLAKQLGPGRLGLSMVSADGKIRNYEIAYTFSKVF